MLKQNRELKNRVREIRSHGSVRGQGRNGLALLGTLGDLVSPNAAQIMRHSQSGRQIRTELMFCGQY